MAGSINNGESGSSVRGKLNATAGEVNANTAAIATKQPLDSDLTTIAGLVPTNNDTLQFISGAWANRTVSQVKTTLALNNLDNTSDANKPVSTAQQAALDLKQDIYTRDTTIEKIIASKNADYTLQVGDGHSYFQFDAAIPLLFNLPTGLALSTYPLGTKIYINSLTTSISTVTITAVGTTLTGVSAIINANETACVFRLGVNSYVRIF